MRCGSTPTSLRRLIAALASLLVAAAALVGLPATSATAAAVSPNSQPSPSATCASVGVTVTPLHRPVGASYRPFYTEFAGGSTLHSNYAGYRIDDSDAFPAGDTFIRITGLNGGSSPRIKAASGQSSDPTTAVVRSYSTATAAPTDALAYIYLTATSESPSSTDPQEFQVEVFNGDPNTTGIGICSYTDGFSNVEDIISAAANKVTGISVTTTRPSVGSTFSATAMGSTGTRGSGPTYDQDAGNGVFNMSPSMSDDWPAKAFQLVGLDLTLVGGGTYQDRIRVYPPGSASADYQATYTFRVGGRTPGPTLFEPRQQIASGTQVKYTGSYSSTFYLSSPVVNISLAKSVSAVVNGGPGDDTITYTIVATNTGDDTGTLSYFLDTLDDSGSVVSSYVAGSTTFNGVSYTDPTVTPTVTGAELYWAGSFAVPPRTSTASGTATLTYQVHVAGSPGSVTNFVVAGLVDDTIGSVSGAPASTTFDDSFPVVTTGVLPTASLGVAYDDTIYATGGAGGPYTNFTVTSGSLPAGLTLNSDGTVSGTPTAPGTYTFDVTCEDSSGNTSYPQMVTLNVPAPAPTITTTSVPDGQVGTMYPTTTLAATGGTPGYSWSLASGSLPDGLVMDDSGVIAGTPTTAGTYTFTARVTDTNGEVDTQVYTMTIADPTPPPPPPPAPVYITNTSLPDDTVGQPYSATLVGAGGSGAYTWSIDSGALPDGLTLDPVTGIISGTPTTPGTYPVTYRVTDAAGTTTTKTLDMVINGAPLPLDITTNALPGATAGVPYSTPIEGSGGTGPYAWAVDSGVLPAGLTLDPATGVLSGTATETGDFPVTIQLTDADGNVTYKTLTLHVNGPLEITTPTVPSGERGTAYSATIEGAGGVGPYSWAVTGGSLPAGLTLDPVTGAISGTPTVSGDFPITVQLTDADGVTTTHDYVIPIGEPAPLVITTDQLPSGDIRDSYTAALAAEGGVGPYSWSIPQGALPGGLVLDPATGVISGNPTEPGTYTFVAAVTDANGDVTEKPFTLTIGAPDPLIITTTTLPGGFVGEPYMTPVEAIGGTGPYSWSYAAGELPPGTRLDPVTGVISGTPTVEGSYPITFKVTDTNGVTDLRTLTVVVNGPLAIMTDTMPTGETGTAYSAPLEGVGGAGPYTWDIVGGSLPDGVTLDQDTGVVSGTPTKGGSYPITVELTDADGRVVTKELVIAINTRAPLEITTTDLPAAEVGTPLTTTLDADGGKGPYLWDIVDGTLPPGVNLDPLTGVISGTPTKSGTFCFTAQVTDVNGDTTVKNFCLLVGDVVPLEITTPSLAGADTGTPYRQVVEAAGGDGGPYTFALAGGALPPGLKLNPDGTITGTPTTAGRYPITIEAKDSSGATAYWPYSIVITAPVPPAIVTPDLPPAEYGEPYSAPLEGTNGRGPYSWEITAGALPPGMTISDVGLVSGTPTEPGTYTFTVTLTDADGTKTSTDFVIVVAPPGAPVIVNPSVPNTNVGEPYQDHLVGEGGAGGPYTFELVDGPLPPGVSLLPDGTLSGIPTKPGTFEITVRIYDKYGNWSLRSYTLRIGDKEISGIRIVQTVSSGNPLRTGGLTVKLQCTKPNGAKVVKSRTLGVDALSREWTVTLPKGTACRVTETATGAPAPTVVSPTWDGRPWSKDARSSASPGLLVVGQSANLSGSPAAAVATVTSPCRLDGSALTADSAGACTVSWSLAGGRVKTRTKWDVARGGAPIADGNGRKVSTVKTTGALTTVTMDNAYRKAASITTRVVQVVESACTIDATAAGSLVRGGSTTAVSGISTGRGCAQPKIEVNCSPILRGGTPRGDFTYCTWVLERDRVVITTRNMPLQVTVTLTAKPKGAKGPKVTWTRTWRT